MAGDLMSAGTANRSKEQIDEEPEIEIAEDNY